MKNKLQQIKIDLMSRKQRIINLKIENERIKNENDFIQKNINKLQNILNKTKKYLNQKNKLKKQCLLYSIFCFILASTLGPLLSTIVGLSSNYMLIFSMVIFVSFYPMFIGVFYNKFYNYSQLKKFLKNNDINKINTSIEKLECKIKLNNEINLVNNKNIDKLNQEIKTMSENFERDNNIKIFDNTTKTLNKEKSNIINKPESNLEKTKEFKIIKTLKI